MNSTIALFIKAPISYWTQWSMMMITFGVVMYLLVYFSLIEQVEGEFAIAKTVKAINFAFTRACVDLMVLQVDHR